MRRPLNLAVTIALLAALAAGTPVPRIIPVDEGTCRALCLAVDEPCAPAPPSGAAAGCTTCPAPDENLPCRQAQGADCSNCVMCQCGVGILETDVVVSPPADAEIAFAPPARLLWPLAGDPASPPPKSSA